MTVIASSQVYVPLSIWTSASVLQEGKRKLAMWVFQAA